MTDTASAILKRKVSVLLPVYRTREEYLRECIESILKQTFQDFELLIVDDCPEYSVEDIVLSYNDSRIKYNKNSHNLGISATRNRLLDMAVGEYLAVMDHDDIMLPKRLQRQVEFLDNNREIGVVGTWYEVFPKGKIKKKFVLNSQIEIDLMYNCSVLHPSAMIRKSVLVNNNIRYEAEFSPAEDHALFASLIGKTKFANIPEVLQLYRDYDNNTSKTQAKKMSAAALKIHNVLTKNYPELMKRASEEQSLKLKGITVAKRYRRGGTFIDKWFNNLLRFRLQDDIMPFDATNLPIYIICYNRLSYVKEMIEMLEKYNLRNIHIIDNASTYPPLLEYLDKTPYSVHKMTENMGHMVFFIADEFKQVRENEYYALTDPDIIPIDECPADFMSYFYMLLQKYPQVNKVGFSLKLDDLPPQKEGTAEVVAWEQRFYKHRLNHFRPYLYLSALDTTFALYRPQKEWKNKDFYKAVRTGAPYEARHLPWYKDLDRLNDEDCFYVNNCCSGSGNWNDNSGVNNIRNRIVHNWYEWLFSIREYQGKKIIRICGIKAVLRKK